MSRPKVGVVIVNWNGLKDTLECLASLRVDTYAHKNIFVVDNGSRDHSASIIRAEYPEVTVLETGENLGFTGGNNAGLRRACDCDCEYIYLLNNDTVSEHDALSLLVEAILQNPTFGVLTPVIHYFDLSHELWFAGSRLDLAHGVAVHDNKQDIAGTQSPAQIPWASGCAMLIKSNLLHDLNGFDERYFLNWEDVDLSLRVRGTGHQIGIVPAAKIYHKVSRSFEGLKGVGQYYYVRNNLLLLRIHCGAIYYKATARVIMRHLRKSLSTMRRHEEGSKESLCITVRAIQDHFLCHYGKRSI